MTGGTVVELGSVCQIVNGGTPKSEVKEYWGGNNQWITPKDMGKLQGKYVGETERQLTDAGLQNCSAKLSPPHSVILSSRAPIGHLAINLRPMATNQGCKTLVPSPKLDFLYLYYFLVHSKQFLNDLGSGTTFKELSSTKLSAVQIPLPPLPVQKAIVANLDAAFASIDTAIAAAEKNAENAKQLYQSYLSDLFQAAVKVGEVATVGDIAELTVGFAFKSKGYTTAEHGVRLLRGDNIVQGSIRWDDAKYWPKSEVHEYEKYKLSFGDLVIAMDRPLVKTGLKRSLVGEHDLPSLLLQRTARIRGRSGIRNDFLYLLISAPQFSHYINGLQTGLGVPHISGQQIKDFTIGVPSLGKQDDIIAAAQSVLQNIDIAFNAYTAKVARLGDLKQASLKRAFGDQQAFSRQLVDA